MASPLSVVEIADRRSRLRAVLFALGTLVFLLAQVITRPTFAEGTPYEGWRRYAWLVNAIILLLCLRTGGFVTIGRNVRALLNDDVSRENYKTACVKGFWIAMMIGIVAFVVPAFELWPARRIAYLVVTAGTSVSLLFFSWLEYRAHADA